MSFFINWARGFNLMIIEYAPQSSSLTSSFHKLYGLINIKSHSEQENPSSPKNLFHYFILYPAKLNIDIYGSQLVPHSSYSHQVHTVDKKRQQQWHRKWKLQERLSIFLLIRISIKELPKLSKILGSNCYISQNEVINKFFKN